MLNKAKVLQEFSKQLVSTCNLIEREKEIAKEIFKEIVQCEDFCGKVKNAGEGMPSWDGSIDEKVELRSLGEYSVWAVDGSQIYPDRHLGINYSLINIGTTFFKYGKGEGEVDLDSFPVLNLECDVFDYSNTDEIIDLKRTKLELETGFKFAERREEGDQNIFLFDGSMIFWYLYNGGKLKRDFLEDYLEILDDFFEKKILYAGYISLSRSRDLIEVLRAGAKLKGLDEDFRHLIDNDCAEFFLKKGERSGVFKSSSRVIEEYSVESQPYFFYFNTGYEIARVEIPAWIAKSKKYLGVVESIVYDQVLKGYGYPVALSEAHEQAVVTFRDRDVFNYLMHLQLSDLHGQVISQKLMKKRHNLY